MIASPCRISPSSTVSESHCPWYGHNAFGTSLISSGHPAMIMSVIAMCVQHTANISTVVASIFIANSFLIRSVSLRACTIWNWMCLSFSASVGKLHLLASPQIHSMSLSGVSPALILISSSWYILHH